MGQLFFYVLVSTIINLTLVKIIFFRVKPTDNDNKQNSSWISAVESMSTMESRIEHLVTRDLKQQEQVWKLQDVNRELQEKTMKLTKQLLAAQNSTNIDLNIDVAPAPKDDGDGEETR